MAIYNRAPLVFTAPLLLLIMVLYINNGGERDNDSFQSGDKGSINAVIGDESYIEKYGILPVDSVPDSIRIRIHLQHVEQKLRARSVEHLSKEQQTNRKRYLNMLNEYRRLGEFPHNDGHPDERRPTFIDKDGHICAVGYLVEQSLGREAVETVNKSYKYAYIQDIDHPEFEKWVAESGFTIRELAMIQPAYGDGEPRIIDDTKKVNNNDIGALYGTASLLLNSANGIYLSNRNSDPWLFNNNQRFHWYGMATGAGSVLLGALNLDNGNFKRTGVFCADAIRISPCPDFILKPRSNHARTAVSALNIASGAATMIRAGYHLFFNSNSRQVHSNSGTNVDIVTTSIPGSNNSYEMAPVLNVSVSF